MGPATISDRGLPPQVAGPLVHAQLTVGVVDGMRVAGGVQRGGLGCGQAFARPRSVSDSTMGLR
jgi:hypothetical protein